ncbi:MAG: 2,3-bisphosphoglycerate-independent phosphoglycerate mutase [Nitrospirota bacterium]|jgi:2,3-bisphosphoglycerate-independent phosphoglycerate mutase
MQDLIRPLVVRNSSKILMLVMDGLGGLPAPEGPDKGKTELEAAETPHMDALAREGACGLHVPVKPAITPGSGPGHLGLFGYDPQVYQIGRGILEALGLDMEIKDTDIAIRGNYATMRDGLIEDRRAGRIPTEEGKKLTARLQQRVREVDGVEVTFVQGMEHRLAIRLRFPGKMPPGSQSIEDTDPQETGKEPLPIEAETPEAERVAGVARKVLEEAAQVLKEEEKANYLLLRGFSQLPDMPSFEEAYGLRALAIAAYPMYRGVAKLVGMRAPDLTGDLREEFDVLRGNYGKYDFFFFHVKKVDSYGEDGNFEAKKRKIEEVDRFLPKLLELGFDVATITGDHSTPSALRSHSWHPVPVLIKAPYVLGALSQGFSERECLRGELGIFRSVGLMPLLLANAGRLKKFGA